MIAIWDKLVGIMNKRKHNNTNDKQTLLGEKKMAQARTLNEKELNLLLLYTCQSASKTFH